MSNQIYANTEKPRKYYSNPGFTIFTTTNNQNADKDQPTIITYDNVEYDGVPHSDYSLVNGSVVINSEGMYSVSAVLKLEDSANRSTNDIDFSADLVVDRPNSPLASQSLATVQYRVPAKGDDNGSLSRHSTLNAVVFLKTNDIISVGIVNFATNALRVVGNNATSLIINKIY